MDPIERQRAVQAVHNLYVWLNQLSGTERRMTLADMERLFAEQAPMVVNNRPICRDRAGHLLHGQDLLTNMRSWHFNLPFERTIVEGNQVVGYFTVDFIAKDGSAGRIHDICIFTVQDGKIAGILENVVFDRQAIEIRAFV